jgi:hypothetical protein
MRSGWKFIGVAAILVASASLFLSVVLFSLLNEARVERAKLTTKTGLQLCREIEKLKGAIRIVIHKGPPSAGRSFALRKFASRDCSKLPTNTGSDSPHLLH